MKTKHLFILGISLVLISCTQQVEEGRKVIAFYPNGQAKHVTIYEIRGKDSIAIQEQHYHSTGELRMQGALKNGKRQGEWKSWFTDGTLWSEGKFDKGLRIDSAISYFPNGKVSMRGFYRQGEVKGVWKVYDETGKLVAEKDYGK